MTSTLNNALNEAPHEINSLTHLTERERDELLSTVSEVEKEYLKKEWSLWARDNQLPPPSEDWVYWLIQAGRGFGKTRCGAEWVRDQVENKGVKRVALIGPTAADVRDVMVTGESGIIGCSRDEFLPKYEPSKRRIIWPNGATGMMYSAEESERLRGPQHEKAWCDELAAWADEGTWDMLQFGMRLGANPQTVITTTPKPTVFMNRIRKLPGLITTRGSMLDNRKNLPESFLNAIMNRYQGTRLGKQEIEGIFLSSVEGAIFSEQNILKKNGPMQIDQYERICVAIDPAVSSGEGSDETGIIVAGSYNNGQHADVLADHSGHYKPNEWAELIIHLYQKWKADKVLGEVNNGGDLVEHTLRQAKGGVSVAFHKLHSSKGKRLRAEPVGALYEQHRVFHTQYFEQLEEQMVTFNPEELAKKGQSPDRVDAMVFALTWLIVERKVPRVRFLHV